MSEQDLHAEPISEPVTDPETVVDELDDLEHLGDDVEVGLTAPEADAVEQRTPAADEAATDDEYPAP
jgi:hypothetical protein